MSTVRDLVEARFQRLEKELRNKQASQTSAPAKMPNDGPAPRKEQPEEPTADKPEKVGTTPPAPEKTPSDEGPKASLDTPPAVETSPSAPEGDRSEGQTPVFSPALFRLLCEQIGNETYNAYFYRGAAAWFTFKGLDGFAKFAKEQAAGEDGHAMQVYEHVLLAGGLPGLPSIEGAAATFKSVAQVLDLVVTAEKDTTAAWREIYKEAQRVFDGATAALAQTMLSEQLEEENTACTLRDRVTLAGDGMGLLVVDNDLKHA